MEPISGLPEVSCPRIGVDLRRDLIDARQRVHQDGVLAHLRKRLLVNAVDALDGPVRLMVREALLLDSGLVHDVDVGQDRIEVLCLDPGHVVLVEVSFQVVAHRHLRRRDEPQLDVLELAEQVRERAHGASVGKVADHGDPHTVDAAELGANRVEVEQGLGRMLSRAVARIDDRHVTD